MTKREYAQIAHDLRYEYATPDITARIMRAADEAAVQRIMIDARHASAERERRLGI